MVRSKATRESSSEAKDPQETNSKMTNQEVSDTEGDDNVNPAQAKGIKKHELEHSSDEDSEQNLINCDPERHKIHEQVMLDVNRCAGRLERMRQVYFHRKDDDEPPEDLTRELELQRIASISGKSIEDLTDGEGDDKNLFNDDDENQFQLDSSLVEDLRNQRKLKRKLAKLIVDLLEKNPQLHYYQGFHDVCLTYMTMLGHSNAFPKLCKLIDSHFSTFMQPTMEETRVYLDLLPILIGLQDKELEQFLENAEVGTIFALSWVITWFSHVIPNDHDVEKIFRFLEIQDPHMVIYLSATIVLYKRESLLQMEPEMSTIHHFLCQIPRKEKLPIDKLIDQAKQAFKEWPPDILKENYARREMRKKLEEEMKLRVQLRAIRAIANQLVTISGFVTSKPFIVILFAAALSNRMGWWSWYK